MKINIRNYFVNKNKGDSKKFDNDYITKSIGAFGRWQLLVCSAAAVTRLIAMWNLLSILFLTPNTEFKCVNFRDNATRNIENSTCYEDCIKYVYHDGIFESNLISEFDLICDRAWLASFVQTTLMFGLFIGTILFGWISDRFGRKKALLLSSLINTIFMFIIPFSPNYWTFTGLRFVIGLANGGIMSTATVFVLEVVGPQYRDIAGSASLVPDFISQITSPLLAYLATTWSIFLLEYAAVTLIISILLFLLPETPRWLMANRKVDEAIETLTKAAIFNKRSTEGIKDNVMKTFEEFKIREETTLTYLDLFKERKYTVITIASSIIFFLTGICYYGISQYSTYLGMNLFVAVAIMAIIQLPGLFIAIPFAKVFGRKASIIGTFIGIGLTMVILVFIPESRWYVTAIAIAGVALENINFTIMYLYASELFPTPIRNMGFGICISASKFGAMVAPFVANVKPNWIAALAFTVLPLIAAVVCLLLPETKGKMMKDTLDE